MTSAVLLVDKPLGPTSHEVVDFVRWAMREKAVGHCGTLDPAASGLLVLCLGSATKLAPYLTAVNKEYRARFAFGRSTTTADAQGDTVREAPVTTGQRGEAAGVVAALVGELRLTPPAYSAVKVKGRAAHERAREGDAPQLEPRTMVVEAVGDVATEGDCVDATILVSKGTYIRSLAEEAGRRLGVPAHLAALQRTRCGNLQRSDPRTVGPFDVSPMPAGRDGKPRHRLRIRDVAGDRAAQAEALAASFIEPAAALPMPVAEVDVAELDRLVHGQAVAAWPGAPHDAMFAVARGAALIVVEREGDRIRPRRVITSP